MNEIMIKEVAGNYALLCSSRKTEASPDTSSGGLFTEILFETSMNGSEDENLLRKEELSLKDIYEPLRRRLEAECDITPELFIGGTLSDFGFVKNTKYKAKKTIFNKCFIDILRLFYNNGKLRELTIKELQRIGSTAHTTYSKLAYSPAWALLEKIGGGKARLTDRGLKFIRGEIEIPHSITKDQKINEWKATKGTRTIRFSDYTK